MNYYLLIAVSDGTLMDFDGTAVELMTVGEYSRDSFFPEFDKKAIYIGIIII